MRLLAVAVTSAITLSACAPDTTSGDGRLEVVAAFYPLAEAASRIGGEGVIVTNLTPAGAEPHDLELSSRQVDQLLDADLVLFVGGGFQPAVERVVRQRQGGSIDLLAEVVAAEPHEAEPSHDDEHAHAHADGSVDPHFWLDPNLYSDAVEVIADALADLAPDQGGEFEARADRYVRALAALDAELDRTLSDCQRREMVTAHAAFGYLASRYGLEELPISGLSPEAEADPGRLDELTAVLRERGVTTVFYETLAPAATAETLAREAGIGTAVLNPLEGLSDDEREEGADYQSVMRDNAVVLSEALGCQ